MLAGILIFVLLLAVSSPATGQGTWDPRFHVTGVDGRVLCAVADGEDLYIGGYFNTAGDVVAKNVAHFDGTEWHALGSGLDDIVYDLELFEGNLVACGTFLHAGEGAVNHVARWNGAGWNPMSGGMPDDPQIALAVYQGDLWCGEYQWRGTYWSHRMDILGGWIRDLAVYEDLLVAGGSFLQVNGVPGPYVAAWNGSTVISMPGQEYKVNDLEVFDGQLLALREWVEYLDPAPVSYWTGSGWDDFGDIDEQYDDVEYRALLAHDDVLRLVAMEDPPGWWQAKISTWDGAAWDWDSGATIYPTVSPNTLIPYRDGLVLGGRFGKCGGVPAGSVVTITEGVVESLGPPGNAISGNDEEPIFTLATTPQGVAVGGSFVAAGSELSAGVALWDGVRWHARDVGPDYTNCWLLAWHEEQLHGFPRSPIHSYETHAIWNGDGWDFYDPGEVVWATTGAVSYAGLLLTSGRDIYNWSIPEQPQRFAEFTDGNVASCITEWAGNLVTGGNFTEVEGVPASGVALYDGFTWSGLGGGIEGDVYALTEFEGRLIAAGNFTEAGGGVSVSRIAAWDGAVWEPLGDGLNHWVECLAVYDGELYAGGRFWLSGTTEVNHIARWDGVSWHPVGNGTDRSVGVMATYGGWLYLAGGFRTVGEGTPSTWLAVWDGDEVSSIDPPEPLTAIILHSPAPNPTRARVDIRFTLGRDCRAKLTLHDLNGRRVETLLDEHRAGGEHHLGWERRGPRGQRLPAGAYLLRLEADDQVSTRKLIVLDR